jgi:hypothetical protein
LQELDGMFSAPPVTEASPQDSAISAKTQSKEEPRKPGILTALTITTLTKSIATCQQIQLKFIHQAVG